MYYLKSRWEACAQPKGMSSQTVHSALVQVQWMQAVLLVSRKRKAEAVMNSDNCRNRNDIACHICANTAKA